MSEKNRKNFSSQFKAKVARVADERQPSHILLAIDPATIGGAQGLRQYADTLIVADRLDMNAALLGQSTDRHHRR